jgi:hypothetical protein
MKKKLCVLPIIVIIVFFASAFFTHANAYTCSNSKNVSRCNSKYLNKKIVKELNKYLNAEENINNFHGAVIVEKKGSILLSKGYLVFDSRRIKKSYFWSFFSINPLKLLISTKNSPINPVGTRLFSWVLTPHEIHAF